MEPSIHAAFVFSFRLNYPPDFNDMKMFYVTKELIRHGSKVSWVSLSDKAEYAVRDSIDFITFKKSQIRILELPKFIYDSAKYFKNKKVKLVYADEWFLYRQRPLKRLLFQFAIKLMGIKFVLDQRDPYIEYEIACNRLRCGSLRHRLLRLEYYFANKLTDLLILPSKAYANLITGSGIPSSKVFGMVRGVDCDAFNLYADGKRVRDALGLEGKFIIGWFGIMLPYRQIQSVIIPLINGIRSIFPDSYMLIGGKGPLSDIFVQLNNQKKESREFTFLGPVPYSELPRYLAACDVLICPVSTEYMHTRYSAWLKIIEALAVGRPIVATKTETTEQDYRQLEGVVWVGSDLDSFIKGITHVKANYNQYRNMAQRQSTNFDDFCTKVTIPKLVGRVLETLGNDTHRPSDDISL